MLHSIYDQPDAKSVAAQYDRVLDALTEKLPAVAAHLDAARADVLAFTAFPKEIVAPDLVQPTGTAQPRDPQADRRGRDLPRP
jgi:transposase-like protein